MTQPSGFRPTEVSFDGLTAAQYKKLTFVYKNENPRFWSRLLQNLGVAYQRFLLILKRHPETHASLAKHLVTTLENASSSKLIVPVDKIDVLFNNTVGKVNLKKKTVLTQEYLLAKKRYEDTFRKNRDSSQGRGSQEDTSHGGNSHGNDGKTGSGSGGTQTGIDLTTEEEAQRKAQEEEASKKAQEEETQRKAQEEEASKKAQEEETQRKAQEEEAKKKAQEEETQRKVQEEEASKKAQEEEANKKAQEEETQRKVQEEETQRKVQEEEARKKAQEEEANKKAQEEEAIRSAAKIEAERAAAEDKKNLLEGPWENLLDRLRTDAKAEYTEILVQKLDKSTEDLDLRNLFLILQKYKNLDLSPLDFVLRLNNGDRRSIIDQRDLSYILVSKLSDSPLDLEKAKLVIDICSTHKEDLLAQTSFDLIGQSVAKVLDNFSKDDISANQLYKLCLAFKQDPNHKYIPNLINQLVELQPNFDQEQWMKLYPDSIKHLQQIFTTYKLNNEQLEGFVANFANATESTFEKLKEWKATPALDFNLDNLRSLVQKSGRYKDVLKAFETLKETPLSSIGKEKHPERVEETPEPAKRPISPLSSEQRQEVATSPEIKYKNVIEHYETLKAEKAKNKANNEAFKKFIETLTYEEALAIINKYNASTWAIMYYAKDEVKNRIRAAKSKTWNPPGVKQVKVQPNRGQATQAKPEPAINHAAEVDKKLSSEQLDYQASLVAFNDLSGTELIELLSKHQLEPEQLNALVELFNEKVQKEPKLDEQIRALVYNEKLKHNLELLRYTGNSEFILKHALTPNKLALELNEESNRLSLRVEVKSDDGEMTTSFLLVKTEEDEPSKTVQDYSNVAIILKDLKAKLAECKANKNYSELLLKDINLDNLESSTIRLEKEISKILNSNLNFSEQELYLFESIQENLKDIQSFIENENWVVVESEEKLPPSTNDWVEVEPEEKLPPSTNDRVEVEPEEKLPPSTYEVKTSKYLRLLTTIHDVIDLSGIEASIPDERVIVNDLNDIKNLAADILKRSENREHTKENLDAARKAFEKLALKNLRNANMLCLGNDKIAEPLQRKVYEISYNLYCCNNMENETNGLLEFFGLKEPVKENENNILKRLEEAYETVKIVEKDPKKSTSTAERLGRSTRDRFGVGFCPIQKGNPPQILNHIHFNGKVITLLGMGSPTIQPLYRLPGRGSAEIDPIFKGNLRHQSLINKKSFYVSNQNACFPWPWEDSEYIRNDEIMDQSEKEESFYAMTCAKNTKFHSGQYLEGKAWKKDDCDAELFAQQLHDQFFKLDKRESGCFISKKIKDEIPNLEEKSEEIISAIQLHMFDGKEMLTRQERREFIELYYNLLVSYIAVELDIDFMNFTCKDGIDRGAASMGWFIYMWMKAADQINDKEAEKALQAVLFTRAYWTRKRNILHERFERFAESAGSIEKTGDAGLQNLKNLLGELFGKNTTIGFDKLPAKPITTTE